MPGDDFFGGFDLGAGALDHAPQMPVEDLFAVEPSRLKAPGRCLCCPKCKGLDVGCRDNGAAQGVKRWQCLDEACKHAWKEPAVLRVVRCYVILDT